MTDDVARIYLMAGRKTWHHDVPVGWKEVAWERFDYIECGIYEKPVADLTETDKRDWVIQTNRTAGLSQPRRPIEKGPRCR